MSTDVVAPLLILNYTNWSSDDVHGLVMGCIQTVGLTNYRSVIGSVVVKNGRPTAWFNQGLQVRLPATGTATPLQVVACNRALSDGELLHLIRDVIKSIGPFHPDHFSINQKIVHLADGLPAWARELPFAKRQQGTREWAIDRIPGLQTNLGDVDREIQKSKEDFEKKMAKLGEKKRKLEVSLGRVAKKCEVKEGK